VGHWFNGSGDEGDQGDQGDHMMCTTASLTTNAVVVAAELSITPSGSFFEKIVLMSCAASGATGSTGTTGMTGSTGATTVAWRRR
jgi:hypothetical protein